MCGIVGASLLPGRERVEHQADVAHRLLRGSVHRGRDATGWAYPGKQGPVVRKLAVPATSPHVRVEIPDEAGWWMGHVRLATRGAPEDARNNHPVWHGRVVGTHNGTIYNADEVLKLAGGRQDPKTEVDSEAIFAAIDAFGVRQGLSKLEGGWSIAWHQLDAPKTLQLACGPRYPLWIAETDDGVFYASEAKILCAALPNRLSLDLRALKPGEWLTLRDGRIARERKLLLPSTAYQASPAQGPGFEGKTLASYGATRKRTRGKRRWWEESEDDFEAWLASRDAPKVSAALDAQEAQIERNIADAKRVLDQPAGKAKGRSNVVPLKGRKLA